MERPRTRRDGVARRAMPLFVLRCAALLAVLVWVLPVCTHASFDSAAATRASAATAVTPAAAATAPLTLHTCPDMRHEPGDTHCRPATGAALATPSVPVPSAETADGAAVWRPHRQSAPGNPARHPRVPGIHQLQVQRI